METDLVLRDVHGDFLIALPGICENLEVEPDLPTDRPSAGQLVEQSHAPSSRVDSSLAPRVLARMKGVRHNRLVAFQAEAARRCRVGKVLSVADDRTSVTVHVYEARAGDRLQVIWEPAFAAVEGTDVLRQVVETLDAKRILGLVELSNGVLNHAAASRLARAGWRVDESTVQHGALQAAAAVMPTLRGETLAPPLSLAPTIRADALLRAGRPLEDLRFEAAAVRERATTGRERGIFVEIFAGKGLLSAAIREGGWPVADGIDIVTRAYGRTWDLRSPADRGCLLHLLFAVLRPWGIHWALPCTKYSTLGGQNPDDYDTDLADFVIDGLEHSAAAGCHASFEGPRSHGLVSGERWQRTFGSPEFPRQPWKYHFPDGCCYRVRSPDCIPLAMQKPYILMATFDLSFMNLRCRDGLLQPLAGRRLDDLSAGFAARVASGTEPLIGAVGCDSRLPAGPAPGQGQIATSGHPGVSRSVDRLSEEERAARSAARRPRIEAAAKKWDEFSKAEQWDRVVMPDHCFRYAETEEKRFNARTTSEYQAAVLEAVGLSGDFAGYLHLTPTEREALCALVRRKSAAFWIKDSARSVMRGFLHDVVTSGAPVRGHPIRLKGEDAMFVREDLEAATKQGLDTRGTSPWGSWAFPTKPTPGC
ncbi:MAG: hypothetical protein VXW31_07575, partial [Planctomycetota bacterium]|nr:hypothetical protein [Planctomycetota bacterium]